MTPEIVGKYPTELLLSILTDGYEWSARGFWAQIKSTKYSNWFDYDHNDGKPRTDLEPDTVLLQIRDHKLEEGRDIFEFKNLHTPDVSAVEHFIETEATNAFCGFYPVEENSDYTPFNLDVTECPTCIVWTDITLTKLAEATDWALENYNHLFSWHTNQKGIRDDIDYDAIGADVIIQKIVLGEVIYG